MYEILTKILISNGYINSDLKLSTENYRSDIFNYKNSDEKNEYFLVFEYIEQSESAHRRLLDEEANNIFATIRAADNIQDYFSKNCTMIICCNRESITSKLILETEEDQYNFKKNIIAYTNDELNSLQTKLSTTILNSDFSEKNINSLLNSNKGRAFSDFKAAGGQSNDYYSLLIKLSGKLPFLRYFPVTRDLEDLEEEILEELTGDQLMTMKKILSMDPSLDDASFEKFFIEDREQ